MVKFLGWFITVLLLLLFYPSTVFAVTPTISVTFPETVEIGKDNEIKVTVNNTTDLYNLKIYGSPVDTKRTKNYAETFNGSEYAGIKWETYPIVQGQTETKIKFRIKPITEDQDYIYLSTGIQYGSKNIYSDWVKVNVTENQNSITTDNTDTDKPSPDPPNLVLELPDNIIFNKILDAKIRVYHTDDKFLIKVLGSEDKKGYGFIKTLNDDKQLSWNSSWDSFPVVQHKGLVNFIIDYNVDALFIKLRGKNLNTGDYLESDWVKTKVMQPKVNKGKKVEDKTENNVTVKEETKSDKITIDYSKIPYKPVVINVYDKGDVEKEINKKEDLLKQQVKVQNNVVEDKNIFITLWKRILEILNIQKK